MTFLGEWKREDFDANAENGDGLKMLKELMEDDIERVCDFKILWEDIGYKTAVFVFQCQHCGKFAAVCQDY